MNKRITLPAIAAGVAEAAGIDNAAAESFMRDLLEAVANGLVESGETPLPGIGTFRVVDSAVFFSPAATMADAVNEPFACFEAVELADDFDENDLESEVEIPIEKSSTPENSHEPPTPPAAEPASQLPPEIPVVEEPAPEEQPEEASGQAPEETSAEECGLHSASTPEFQENNEEDEAGNRPHRQCEPGSFNGYGKLVLGLAIGLIVGYLTGRYSSDHAVEYDYEYTDSPLEVPAETPYTVTVLPVASDTIDSEETPAEAPDTTAITAPPREVTDTIARNRYLTVIARRHYGDYRFWVYIYEENRDVITDPDRVAPGTIVKIPPAEKYGIDAADPASLRAAELKSREIRSSR